MPDMHFSCKYHHALKDRKVGVFSQWGVTSGCFLHILLLFLTFCCFSLYVQPALPFATTFLHILFLFLTFCWFVSISSTCPSFHHDFSPYSLAFLDFLLVCLYMFNLSFFSPRLFSIFSCFSWLFAGLSLYVQPVLPFTTTFLHILLLFLTFCWVFSNFQVFCKSFFSRRTIFCIYAANYFLSLFYLLYRHAISTFFCISSMLEMHFDLNTLKYQRAHKDRKVAK